MFIGSLLVVLGRLMAVGPLSQAGAQDATPESQTLAEGVSVEPLAIAAVEMLPPAPAGIVLSRYRLEPGPSQVTPATDPSLALIYEESGTGTIRLEAPVVVTRGAAGTHEDIAANTDFTFEPGDSFAWPPYVAGEVRNEGTEPATALAEGIVPEAGAALAPVFLRQFPAAAYPHLAASTVQHVLQPGYDVADEFAFGLDLILDGLERAKNPA